MRFFDKLSGIFGLNSKKEEEKKDVIVRVFSPLDGRVLPLSEVPDETFAQGLLGDGIGIEPLTSGIVKAPVSGKIIQLFETKHAFVVETKEGVQVLTHFGLNTVKLNGAGFEGIAKEGDLVKAGDPIVKFDYEFLKENADSIITPVVILESEEYKNIDKLTLETAEAGKSEILKVEI